MAEVIVAGRDEQMTNLKINANHGFKDNPGWVFARKAMEYA